MSERLRGMLAAGGLALAALFVAGFVLYEPVVPGYSSVEIVFAEPSPGGLSIVPASCPSVPTNPDYPHDTCSCPAPQILLETTCVCPNGLNPLLYPSCACPDGWNTGGGSPGATGTCSPPDSCPLPREMVNGSCQCPTGSSWNGSTCTLSCPAGQIWDGTNCACPAGTAWNGTACINTWCPSGQVFDIFQGCICPTGTQWNGTQCVTLSCPTGYIWNGTQCVAQCTSSNYCAGTDRTGDGIGDDVWTRNAQCIEAFSHSCPWGCYNGQCVGAPQGLLEITVTPHLVRRGETTEVSWDAQNVSSCTIGENNPGITDEWSGAMMGCANNSCGGSNPSSAIEQQTRYTLTCAGVDGNTYTSSAVVNILPVFIEK